jgi:hypothetical protein
MLFLNGSLLSTTLPTRSKPAPMELDMAERPMSVKEISLQSQEVKFDVNISLKAYLRSAQTLKHEVRRVL